MTGTRQRARRDTAAGCQVSCLHHDAVARARAALPASACVERASELLHAVADPTRLRIVAALAECELCVCDIAAVVGMSQSAVSHQLRLLREQSLVTSRREGRVVYYRLLDAHVTDLVQSAVAHAREPLAAAAHTAA